MEYLPGNMHVSLQRPIALEILCDFNAPICKSHYSTTDLADDRQIDILELKSGDTLVIRLFKPYTDSILYAYIDKSIKNNIEVMVKKDSLLSRAFIELNTENNVLFRNITKSYFRDEKINSLLDEKM